MSPVLTARLVGAFQNSHCEGAGELGGSDPHFVLFVPGGSEGIKAKKEDLQFSLIHSFTESSDPR